MFSVTMSLFLLPLQDTWDEAHEIVETIRSVVTMYLPFCHASIQQTMKLYSL